MYCKYCGKKIDTGSKYCKYCGKKLEADSLNSFDQTHTYPASAPKKKNKTGRVVLWIVGVAVCSLVLFLAIVAVDAAIDLFSGWNKEYESSSLDDANIEAAEKAEAVSEENTADDKDSLPLGFDLNTPETTDKPKEISEPQETPESVALLTFALSFNDLEMTMDSTDWHEYIYGEGYYDMGSVDDYYRESSKGSFTFVPANETHGIANDGIIDIKLDMNHPSFDFHRSDDEYYADGFALFEKVLKSVDDHVVYSQYDYNHDGYIVPEELSIVFIFAGYESYEGYDSDISTYSCSLIYDDYLEVDGVLIDECIYTAEKDPYNEGDNQIMGIGVMCHELGHALDLPDLYDTDYSSEGLAFHCLMAGGCDNCCGYDAYGTMPAPLTAWEREFLGFAEPEIISESGTYTAYARSVDEYNILKIEEGGGYYLIENVDFKGFGKGLEDYVESPGIAIWYVDKGVVNNQRRFNQNDINDDEDRYGVSLMEANDTSNLSKKNFDYYQVYDHYHYLNGDNVFVTPDGVTIEILSNPQDAMEVKVTLP